MCRPRDHRASVQVVTPGASSKEKREEDLEFRLLGPVEILWQGRNIMPTAPKPRQVISLLMLRHNTVVQAAELIDELWPELPPPSAITTLQTYIYKFRKILMKQGADDLLRTQPGGYILTIPPSTVDVNRFERDADDGQELLQRGDAAGGTKLGHALALWRGPALADVVASGRLFSYVTRLEELRFRILELRIEADLATGRHRELVSELKSLVLAHPLHEHLHGLLMLALHRSGRPHEALEVYRSVRHKMIEDLALEPAQDFATLHHTLLSDSPPEAPEPLWPAQHLTTKQPERVTIAREPAPDTAPSPLARPAQLPADIVDFVGRRAVLDRLVGVLAQPGGSRDAGRTAVRVGVVTGAPGVGKSVLAVHAAHTLRPRYPDGQLYADLRGSSSEPRDQSEVLAGFLRALDIPPARIPDRLEERGALFRSCTAGRRVLVLLDDVACSPQVRHLLPGDPHCALLATGRRRMPGLVEASHVELGLPGRTEGREMLARVLGRQRVEREPAAADTIVTLLGHHPLALRCVAGRSRRCRGCPWRPWPRQLDTAPRILDAARLGELDVRSRFDLSYEGLSPVEQGVFRLLSMLESSPFTVAQAAGLLGWRSADIQPVLEALADNHLLSAGPGGGTAPPATPTHGSPWRTPGERLEATLSQPRAVEGAGAASAV
uniref:Snora n=1 Tax=Streptomyces nogalater TaxID=38314 RepID=Q54494_STRNO|nr:Snora [Streptomyces nogalater]